MKKAAAYRQMRGSFAFFITRGVISYAEHTKLLVFIICGKTDAVKYTIKDGGGTSC